MKRNITVTVVEGNYWLLLFGKGVNLYNPDKFFSSLTEADKYTLSKLYKNDTDKLNKTIDWLIENPPESQFSSCTVRVEFEPRAFSLHKYPPINTIISKITGVRRIINDSEFNCQILSHSREKLGNSLGTYRKFPYLNEFSRLITYEDFVELIKKGFDYKLTLQPYDPIDEQLRDYISFYVSVKKF